MGNSELRFACDFVMATLFTTILEGGNDISHSIRKSKRLYCSSSGNGNIPPSVGLKTWRAVMNASDILL